MASGGAPAEAARILVTGAGGFVGRAALPAIRAAFPAAAIVGADRSGTEPADGIRAVSLDVADPDAVMAAVADIRPTAVLHLAAIAAPAEARSDRRLAFGVNLFGTINLAEAVLRHAPEALFIAVGSSDAYGRSFALAAGPLDENAPLRPANPYALTKAAADLAIGQFAVDGLRAVRFRPFNHTGPGQPPKFVVPAIARQVARIERGLQPPVIEAGNLGSRRDFLDVRDVVAGYVAALGTPEAAGPDAVFNLASGTARRIGDIVGALAAMASCPIEVRSDPGRLRAGDIACTEGDATRAREAFGWAPAIPFEKTLADVLAHWRQADLA